MDEAELNKKNEPEDPDIRDITVCLNNSHGIHKLFLINSFVLRAKSMFFVDQLSSPNSSSCIETHCSVVDYNHYVHLLSHLHLPTDSLVHSLRSVSSALGILQFAVSLQCEEIVRGCVGYLEAVPWEDKEEVEILRVVPEFGHVAMPILPRLKPPNPSSTKNVFLTAVRYAMSISAPCPPFGDEIKTSAQKQIEYMLGEVEDTLLVTADEEVKSEIRRGLFQMFSIFEEDLASLQSDKKLHNSDNSILNNLMDLDWLCIVLPKMNLMRDFVLKWAEISNGILNVVEPQNFECVLWRLKLKLIEITAKVLDAVGYGSVVLPTAWKMQLLKTWLPYIRKMKPVLDSVGDDETGFPHRMDEDLWQSIQGAIISFIVTLPSGDQAEILAGWMESQQLGFPDLTEAFEIWCYRTKSSTRRLVEGLDTVSNGSGCSDLSAWFSLCCSNLP